MNDRIQILMYHQVGIFPAMDSHRATYCDYHRFRTQMRYLKLAGYTVLTMTEVLQCLKGSKPIPPRAVALTFDDAYENFYEYAFPVLQMHGFPATVYAIASMLGKPASWLSADGHSTPPLMDGARLRELEAAGIEIGSHAFTHIRLAGQSPEIALEEATRSKAVLEDVLGTRVDHFCYPYGSHNKQTVEAVAAAGYLTATTCERATVTREDDPLTLPRKAVAWGDSLVGVWWKMHMKNMPKRPLIRR
jgi:peptidoglycan/xylan/chitin deacetylase (PgdA/CDA1 family)